MAAEKDLELDENSETEGKPKKKLIIIIVLVVLLLVGGGGAAAYFLFFSQAPEEQVATQKEDGEGAKGAEGAEGDEAQQSDGANSESDDASEQTETKAQYIQMDPAFVISYQVGARARFLQMRLELMTRNSKVAEAITNEMPMLRNTVVILMGQQDFASLRTQAGREALQTTLLTTLNTALAEEASIKGIEAVLFTDYVMQ